jgi:AcrR family transcriptional regulator
MTEKDKAYITKQKITDAAIEIFSEKGFGGARVDEIAAKAKVNKAMIYYYYDSKENLFAEIIKIYLKDCDEFKAEIKNEINWEKIDEVQKYFGKIEKFLEDKKDLIRIIFMDYMKSGFKESSLLSTVLPIFQSRKEELKKRDLTEEETIQILINRFFYITIPLLGYSTFADDWFDIVGVDKEKAKDVFIKTFIKHQVGFFNSLKK